MQIVFLTFYRKKCRNELLFATHSYYFLFRIFFSQVSNNCFLKLVRPLAVNPFQVYSQRETWPLLCQNHLVHQSFHMKTTSFSCQMLLRVALFQVCSQLETWSLFNYFPLLASTRKVGAVLYAIVYFYSIYAIVKYNS